ncbi:MAG: PorV/PorQ family protein [Ignavibacteriaceae bacterium]
MFRQKLVPGIIFILFCYVHSFGQSSLVFRSLLYPHSLSASGLGEQGAATKNAFDAMQYNPANLVYADNLSVSYYRNPWNLLDWANLPLSSVNVLGKLPNGGSVGLAYTYWNMGEATRTTADNPDGEKFHFYERSLAAGYAMPINDHFAVGGNIRYVWSPISDDQYLDQVLFSLGATYTPERFSNRLNIGFSLMNFGGTVEEKSGISDFDSGRELTSSYPPPAQINIGFNALAVTNPYFDINVIIGAKKPLDKIGDSPVYEAQSSFTSLFNDWTDFPNDVTGQIGLSYLWHPLNLGSGISFFQEMYLGYFSVGPKDGANSFYTHGFNIGLKGEGMKASLGYAGRWHNNKTDSYMNWDFPWETFQFSFSSDVSFFNKSKEETQTEGKPKSILLSSGYAYGSPFGKMKEQTFGNEAKISYDMKNIWSVEADFYINDNSSILSAFKYSRMDLNIDIFQDPYPTAELNIGVETVSLESGYRYHPIEQFHPFFVQASVGIIRLNYVLEKTSPRYFYQAFDELAVGVILPVLDSRVVVIPKFGLTALFMDALPNKKRLVGYNQFRFGLNVGYQL